MEYCKDGISRTRGSWLPHQPSRRVTSGCARISAMPETTPGEAVPPAAGATASGGQPFYRRSVLFFCLTTFFFWAALYVYVPVLAVYAQSLGANLSMVGVVVAAYAVPQLLLRIPLGVWFDTLRRRKPVVAAGVAMTSVGALGLALAPDPWSLTLARAVTGVGAASWVALTVYFASYHRQQEAGHAIGVITFVNSAALVAASLFGGIIAEKWGFKYTFFAGALLGLMGVAALVPAGEPEVEPAAQASWGVFARVATHPLLMLVSLMSILAHFANFASVFGFVPVYAAGIGASRVDLGIVTMLALASSAVAALLVEPVARRRGSRSVIVLGSVLMCVTSVAVPFIHRVSVLGASQVVYGLGR
ncbi:MAG: MFS transporter, partial [Chloroflexota bacterium]